MAQPKRLIPLPQRFVVLHHTGIPEPHFDFMIESHSGGPLYTWRCHDLPTANRVTSGDRQPNHRPLYLDYQGEISGNRGRVQRIVAGGCQFRRYSKRVWLFVPDVARYPAYLIAPTGTHYRRWNIEALLTAIQPP